MSSKKKIEEVRRDVQLYIVPGKEPGFKTVITWSDDGKGMPWEFVWVAPTLPPPNGEDKGWLHEAVVSPSGIELEGDGRLRQTFR